MAETGQAQPLLHVCSAADMQQPPGEPREEHLIPYVPEIVPSIDMAGGELAWAPLIISLGFAGRAIEGWSTPHPPRPPVSIAFAPPDTLQTRCTSSHPRAFSSWAGSTCCWPGWSEFQGLQFIAPAQLHRPSRTATAQPACTLSARRTSLSSCSTALQCRQPGPALLNSIGPAAILHGHENHRLTSPRPASRLCRTPGCAARRRDLEPFTHPAPLSLLCRMGLRIMPTSAQLAAAGRRDLVAAVKQAGGFLEVAQALGLRSQRKPAGYWDDESNLGGRLPCPALLACFQCQRVALRWQALRAESGGFGRASCCRMTGSARCSPGVRHRACVCQQCNAAWVAVRHPCRAHCSVHRRLCRALCPLCR